MIWGNAGEGEGKTGFPVLLAFLYKYKMIQDHFTSRAGLFFSLSLCRAMSLSVLLVEGSVVGTGWLPRQNGWSQTTDCAVGSLWDSEEVGC